jgi:hypothetical protein
MKDNFVFATHGTKYACQRTVVGTAIQTQTIEVLGIGVKEDTAKYGYGHQPISSMVGAARIIADTIIKG